MSLVNVLTIFVNGLLGIAFIALFVYVKWRHWDNRYKGLGDGGIQTIFGRKKQR